MTQRLDYQHIAPGGVKALGGVYMYVANSGLSATLLDLVYLRVSQINGCAYCIDSHSRDLMKKQVPVSKIMLTAAWHEAGDIFSDQEKAALQWAETVTLVSQTHIPDAAYQAAAAHFSEKELVDLTIAVGLINTYNRIAIGFRRGPEGSA
jgi:AhpD family alkylhydroperoxidase